MRTKKINPVYDRTWLERARRVRGITQRDVANAVGCTITFYNRIEFGLQIPSVYMALAICDYLGVDVHNFASEKPLSE